MVQNTTQLAQIFSGNSLKGENVHNAVIINTYGEAVPIPSSYCQAPYSTDNYAYYSYFVGQRVNLYNWTWASIVGFPFYYVSNTASLSSTQNSWGIYGMQRSGSSGSRGFLAGLNNQSYTSNSDPITDSVNRQVTFTQNLFDQSNYYGIYPSTYQTSTRALSSSKLAAYNLVVGLTVFNPSGDYLAGAIYNHYAAGSSNITGSFLALGLTRTPDIRVTGLSLLSYYQPRIYSSQYTANGTSRLVVLQLGLMGSA
jgi:hypothetical protein